MQLFHKNTINNNNNKKKHHTGSGTLFMVYLDQNKYGEKQVVKHFSFHNNYKFEYNKAVNSGWNIIFVKAKYLYTHH